MSQLRVRTFERRRLSAQGNTVELSFDWLTLQTHAFKVSTQAALALKNMVGGCKVKD